MSNHMQDGACSSFYVRESGLQPTYDRHHRDVPVLSVILSERSASPLLGGSTCSRARQTA